MGAYVRNIVLANPGGTWDEYLESSRLLAAFYGELLGMRIIREDWMKIAHDADSSPQIAFGDGPGEYRPPRWPDPDQPQQLHLDIGVHDLDAAHELVLRGGASVLSDQGEHRVYADPVGHPFCLYSEPSDEDGSPGRIARVVFDCLSPRSLAAFYEEVLDMRSRALDTPERVVIGRPDGSGPMLAFQHAVFVPPRWPDPEFPQQVHLDLYCDDAAVARETRESAVRLGAIALPAMGGSCPVYADPAGHPFCLCAPGE